MLSGGTLGSYHIHQLGSTSESPLSPTTSSSQVRTMPFMVTSRYAEIAQTGHQTSENSPFSFNPGDGFVNSGSEPKHDSHEATTASINSFFPPVRRREMDAEDPVASLGTKFALPPISSDAPQQMLYLGTFQSAGIEIENSQSSGTSAGSSQPSNGERHHVAGVKDEFSYGQPSMRTSSSADEKKETSIGSGPSIETDMWNGNRKKQGPVIHQQEQQTFNQPTELADSSSDSVRVYPGENSGQTNAEIFPAYSTNLMTSNSYNFPTGAELLAVPMQTSSHLPRASGPNGVQDGGSTYEAVYSSQNITGRGYCSQALKVNWTSIATQYASSSLLDSNVSSSMLPFDGTILSGSLEENNSSHGAVNRDGIVPSYICSPQMQTETMQLCLKPSYSSGTSTSPGNLVLISNPGCGNLLDMHSSNQQHFLSLPLTPALLAQSALTHRSQLTNLHSNLPQQGIPASLSGPEVANQGYNSWRNGGNELLFLPGSDCTRHSLSTGQLSTQIQQTNISQYDSKKSSPLSSVEDQAPPQAFFQNGDGQSLSTITNCQGLSLSLSSQEPSSLQLHPNHGRSQSNIDAFAAMSQASAEAKGKRTECTDARYNGILSRFRPQRDDSAMAGQGLHDYRHSVAGKHQLFMNSSDPYLFSSLNIPHGSRYLKLSQNLLTEVCVVSRCGKSTTDEQLKAQQRCSWNEPINNPASFRAREFMGSESTRKDYMANGTQHAGSSAILTQSRCEENAFGTEVPPESREEMEKKKLRLETYVEEVDRRYASYGEHLTAIINDFNSVAGSEAAKPYTALALQAMSRHFRCLKDSVSSQLRAVKIALGEQEISPTYGGRDVPALRFNVDQQLRQQRALQQLSLLQQHAWRPQRGLPERAVTVLRSWLFEHFLHPYPKDNDKLSLAKQTGLTRSQVSNWFINARVRLWKPMVEEMYLEEFNTSDEGASAEGNGSRDRRMGDEASRMDPDDENTVSGFSNSHAEKEVDKEQITIHSKRDGTISNSSFRSSALDSKQSHGSTSDNLGFDVAKGSILKKSRSCNHNIENLASNVVSFDVDSAHLPHLHNPCRISGRYGSSAAHHDQDYSQHQDILASNGGRFGTYMEGSLSGYADEFLHRSVAPTNGGVSLTLGLRHSDGLSPSATGHHQYGGRIQSANNLRSKDQFNSGVVATSGNMDHAHSDLPASYCTAGQNDHLKQRNQIPSHQFHEFVAQG